MGRKNKKGVSPVIATVLLIAMVIVIGLIIFLWFRSLTQEAVTKFGNENIELACDDVDFLSSYSGGVLSLSNIGNVPIYDMKVKISKQGSHTTEDLSDISPSWSSTGLRQGGTFSSPVSEFGGAEEVIIMPVLLGASSKGQQTYSCDEQYGREII